MNTVLVDIDEKDISNFALSTIIDLKTLNEEGHSQVFKTYPFTLYRNRMMYDKMITMQIPVENYCLYLAYGLVESF